MPFFRPRSASSESYTSTSSSITFSTETGPGAHAPLGALPRRAQRKSLFHIQNDDDTPPTPPTSSPPDTPPEPAHQDPVGIPFPSSFSAASGPLSPSTPSGPISPPAIVRSGSSSIILSNGKPLKPSLKSSSSSSISDAWAAQQQNAGNGSTNRSLHTRAQSMPSTPAFTPKNVHFQEDERLATVRVFRSTGRPRSVSTQNEDTETETEVEQPRHLSAYPFPAMGPLSSTSSSRTPLSNSPLAPIMDIDPSPMRTSPIPSPTASPYANVHLESISLPPSRPPVLRGAVLVRNISFEKRVSVRFTLDDWTTVSEVAATYASSLSAPHPVLPTASPATIGDIMARQPGSATTTTNQWDRFNFAIRLEDYEARLADRTLVLAAAYSAPGVGDWWDNNAGANYRVGFRPRAPPSSSSSSSNPIPTTQPIRSKPSTSPFLNAAAPPPAAPRNTVNISNAFSTSNGGSGTGTPPRPVQLVRSVSTPSAPTARTLGRLALKHYAAPAPPALSMPERRPSPPSSSPERKQQTSPLKIFGGQFATQVENGADKVKKSGNGEEEVHVDEGFETGSDDDDEDKIATPTSASPVPRRAVKPGLHIPSSPAPTLAARGPFSPTRASPVPFGSASPVGGGVVEGRGDATYAALIREWCFAQGDATGGAATTTGVTATTTVGSGLGMPGKQNMLWVGMGG